RLLLLVLGCNASTTSEVTDLALSTGADLTPACARQPAAADRTRKVVVSHPFAASGQKDTRFEVLELDTSGTLTKTNLTFNMGTANSRAIQFTPDGEIGVVAQDDGSLGVFRFDAAGMVQVINAAFKGGFYATDVAVDAGGAWVLDENTDNNGGGLYRVDIGCDGMPQARGRVIP